MGGALVSFDPNLRPPLWESLEEARKQIAYGLSQCDILKIADNELEFMTGETNLDKGAAALRRQYPNIRLFNVTAGPEGSCSYYADKRVFVPACKLGGDRSKPPGPGIPSAPAFSTSCWSMGWMDWRKRT